MNNLPEVSFCFESTQIRVIMKNDEPWFVAADVCAAVSVINHRDAISKLDADEKGVALTDTQGGQQEIGIISESGMYTIILRCRDAIKPGTVPYRFRKWITAEVLPKIRRTGAYSSPSTAKAETSIIPAPGRYQLLLTVEQHQVIKSELVTNGAMLLHPDDAAELMRRAGYVVIHHKDLGSVPVAHIASLCATAAREEKRWLSF